MNLLNRFKKQLSYFLTSRIIGTELCNSMVALATRKFDVRHTVDAAFQSRFPTVVACICFHFRLKLSYAIGGL